MTDHPTQITTIDQAACAVIEEAALKAVTETAAAMGLTVTAPGGGRFDVGSFKMSLQFTVAGGDRITFERHAASLGLDPSDYGREWTEQGRAFKVTGVAPGSRRYPILATIDGRPMKLTLEGLPFGRYSRLAVQS
jgi:hypothetical protein